MAKTNLPKQKHVPMRTCIATGKKLPKQDMVRIVRVEDPKEKTVEVQVDPKGKLRGRGANIEMNVDSFDLAVKKGAISRALKLEKQLTDTQLSELRTQFIDAIAEKQFRKGNQKVAVKITKSELEKKLSE